MASSQQAALYIDAATHRRAVQYARNQHVLRLQALQDGTFAGVVCGSQPKPYHCVFNACKGRDGAFNGISYGRCDCPVQDDLCKHIVACFIVLQQTGAIEAVSATPESAADKPHAKGQPVLTPERWLRQAQIAVAPPPPIHEDLSLFSRQSKHSILYVLRLHAIDGPRLRPVLSLFRGLRRTSGVYDRVSPLTQLRANQISPQDEQAFKCLFEGVAEQIEALSDDGRPQDAMLLDAPVTLLLSGPGLAKTLENIAATGRLYYQNLQGPVLTVGPPRWGKLVWVRGADFKQRLNLALVPPAQLCIFEDVPVFIAPEDGQFGRIVTDLHPGLLAQLAEAPAVAPEAAAKFAERISGALGTHLPTPEIVPVLDVSVDPVGSLRLRTQMGDNGQAHVVADVQFRYGDQLVPADAADEALYRQTAEGIVRVRRRTDLEKKAQKALTAAGARPQKKRDAPSVRDLGPSDSHQAIYDASNRMLQPLQAAGWEVHMGADHAAKVVEVDDLPEAQLRPSAQRGWFDMEMGITLGDKQISLVPILVDLLGKPEWGLQSAALQASDRQHVYVPVAADQVVALPKERVLEILAIFEALGDLAEIDGDGRIKLPMTDAHLLLDLRRRDKLRLSTPAGLERLAMALRDSATPPEVPPPKGLRATLRGYQHTGMCWLQMLRAHQLSGVLADDMGLGKTVQTLAHLLLEKQAGRLEHAALVVCPTSVLGTWQQACAYFTPALRMVVYHGLQRQWDENRNYDLLLTTYGTLLRDVDTLADVRWSVFVLDEAQMVKNPLSKTYVAACRPEAAQHLALTGTPLENNLQELWALMNWTMPGILGTRQRFDKYIAKPIEAGANARQQSALLARLKPFLLRRRKSEVMGELPPRTEIIETIDLQQKQRDLYEVVRSSLDQTVRDTIRKQGMARSMLTILDALLKLRQVCCDPRLLSGPLMPKKCPSAKFERLFELLPDLIEAGRRVLIFSQFTSMLDLIEEGLLAADVAYHKLTGRTRHRETVVQAFRQGTAPIFLISLKAGGTGLNLPEADTVIHYDPWWNPAAEDQATARAHRMGQKNAVFVYKLVVARSVEAKILELQAHKRALFDALLNGGVLKGQLSAADVDNLLAPMA